MSKRIAALCALCICGMVRLAAAQAVNTWPSEFAPRPLAARPVNFPQYDTQTLPNGLRVIAVAHHEQPVVSIRLLIGAGSSLDPKGKTGLAHLTAALLDQGTTTMSASQLNDAIDFIGGGSNAGAGTDLTFVNMLVMKDSFDSGLRMLSDMARHPAFETEELARQRQQLLSSLQVSLDDPDFIANAVFDRLVYGFHPYGLPQSGTPDTLSAITRDDLIAFHQKYFVPNNAILAVVGDISPSDAFAAARRVLADWERREVPPPAFTEPPNPTQRVVIVNKPDSVQTEVRVGNIGIPRNHPDYMAVNLAIRVLGGEGSNRLHQVLRTARGLTYGAQANFDTFKESGDFEAETNTRTVATGEVLRLIVDEFWKLRRERVSERELSDAKAYLTGSFPLTIETPNAIATQIVNVLFYGLPVGDLQNFRERVNAVTVDDIQRVAKLYLKPDRLSVVLVGNAAEFKNQLQGIGFGGFETVDLQNLDLTAVDFKRPVRRAASGDNVGDPKRVALQYAAQSAVGQNPARALLDRVINAMGGIAALRAVKTIVAIQTVTTPTPQGPRDTETTSYIAYPDKFRVEATTPVGALSSGFDGQVAWARDPSGVHEVPAEGIAEARNNLKRDVIRMLLEAADNQLGIRLLQDVRGADGRSQRVLEFTGPDQNPIVLNVDGETFRVLSESYAAGTGGQALVSETFSDYRTVSGVQMPFSAERRAGPLTVRRRVTNLQINSPIDPSQFARPRS
ncbi:MAG TPA: pitrilysin family protein [Vicinamibacterales bacterium]|nr:pitrilysin family protein [Vicinamibacterales bacterium]